MKKHENNFNIAFPLSVNADHQEVAVFHGDSSEKPDEPYRNPFQEDKQS